MVAFEALAVATILPATERDLGGLRLYGWTFSGFLLASLVGIVWAGEQCDRVGPSRPLLSGLVLFGIGLCVAGLAPAMWVLVAGRVVQGLGAGAVPAVAYVCISRGYSEAQRPRMFALMSTAWVVPGLAGPGIAGVIAETTSWRLVFLGLVPLLAIAIWITIPAVRSLAAPESPAERMPTRIRTALALTGGASLVLAGVTSPTLVVGAPLVVAGLAIAVPALRALLPAGALRLRSGLPAAVVGMGLLNLAFFGADAYIPYSLTTLRGHPTYVAGIVLTLTTIAWTSGSWMVDRLSKRLDRRVTMCGGLLLIAAGSGGVALSLLPAAPIIPIIVIAWSAAAFGIGMAYPSFSLATLAQAPAGEEGLTSSSLKLCESLGAAIGTGAGGALIAAGESAGHPAAGPAGTFVLMAAVAALATLVALRTGSAGRE
ncbi:hypothetical protein AYO38_10230 [bacterium SCGC AG-212-C10]|nr:hypothetical protein AYO38_10230 [bacterium SCGC AG-212-C10]